MNSDQSYCVSDATFAVPGKWRDIQACPGKLVCTTINYNSLNTHLSRRVLEYIACWFVCRFTSLLALILKPLDNYRREDYGFPRSAAALPWSGAEGGDLCRH